MSQSNLLPSLVHPAAKRGACLSAAFLLCLTAAHYSRAAGDAATSKAPFTKAECEAFAVKLEQSIAEGDTQAVARAMDPDAMLDVALSGMPASAQLTGFRAGFKSSFVRSLGQSFAQVTSYKLLRLVETNGQWMPRHRLLNDDGGLNYHDLRLARDRTGAVRVADLHVAIMGEWMSATVRRVALPMLARTQKSVLERLLASEGDLVKYEKQWTNVIYLSQKNDAEGVLAAYAGLPVSLQQEKFLLIHRLKAAQRVSEDEYQKAIRFWEHAHPGDVSLQLISIDGLAMRKQYAKVVATVDQLDKTVGGDPYLNVLRANQYSLLSQPDKARQCADKALQSEPTLAPAYDMALTLALKRKDHPETARLLTAISKHLGTNPANAVDEYEEYAEFRKSAACADWKKSLPAK